MGKAYQNLGQQINARKSLEQALNLNEESMIRDTLSEIKLNDAEELSYKYDVDLNRVEEGL